VAAPALPEVPELELCGQGLLALRVLRRPASQAMRSWPLAAQALPPDGCPGWQE
jgi:hypothetical protein